MNFQFHNRNPDDYVTPLSTLTGALHYPVGKYFESVEAEAATIHGQNTMFSGMQTISRVPVGGRQFSTVISLLGRISEGNQRWSTPAKDPKNEPQTRSALKASLSNMGRFQQAAKLESEKNAVDNAFVRRFQPNATYDPFDLSLAALRLDRGQQQKIRKSDRFKKAKLNPLALWKDSLALSSFVSVNGRILPGHLLGTKGVTQRRLAKAIRRARAAGLLSTVHKSVECLYVDPPSRPAR